MPLKRSTRKILLVAVRVLQLVAVVALVVGIAAVAIVAINTAVGNIVDGVDLIQLSLCAL